MMNKKEGRGKGENLLEHLTDENAMTQFVVISEMVKVCGHILGPTARCN